MQKAFFKNLVSLSHELLYKLQANQTQINCSGIPLTNEEYTESIVSLLLIESWWLKSGGIKLAQHPDGMIRTISQYPLHKSADAVKQKIVVFLTNYWQIQPSLGNELEKIVYFYEHFIHHFNHAKKRARGVYYTPVFIADFIIKNIDVFLINQLGIPTGLASTITWQEYLQQNPLHKLPKHASPSDYVVQLFDPAMGAGTFYLRLFRYIHQNWLTSEHPLQDWPKYVKQHLLPRVYACELLLAPYLAGRLLLSIQLQHTGCELLSVGNQIWRGNGLSQATMQHLQKPVSIVLGNPPYGKMSENMVREHRKHIDMFRFINGQKIKERGALAHELNLNDDYVKFYALGLNILSSMPIGLISFVSNSGFLSSRSLRGMRWQLLQSFQYLCNIDLGGRVADNDPSDENLFIIEQGLSISLMGRIPSPQQVHFAKLRGSRQQKSHQLRNNSTTSMNMTTILPEAPDYFMHRNLEDFDKQIQSWHSISSIFPRYSGGIITSRDALVINQSKSQLMENIRVFARLPVGDQSLSKKLGYKHKKKWKVEQCKQRVRQQSDLNQIVQTIIYRPFDKRFIYYDPLLIDTPSQKICTSIFTHENRVLILPKVKTGTTGSYVYIADVPCETKACSHDRSSHMFPLYFYSNGRRQVNLGDFWQRINQQLPQPVSAQDLFSYITALLHLPEFQQKYIPRNDFPKIPLPKCPKIAMILIEAGHEITACYLHNIDTKLVKTQGKISVINKIQYNKACQTICLNKDKSFVISGVPEHIWEKKIGGYQVVKKLLSPYKNKVPTQQQMEQIFIAIGQIIKLHATITQLQEKVPPHFLTTW